MSEYQVLARKYRPQNFSEVIGQQPIITTLKNAILMQKTAHAYLFCGCRGTGKTTLARLLAKSLNCSNCADVEPCNKCPSCQDITESRSLDVLEIDGASHRGIEDIRQINETVGFTPTNGKYKIYLIDEVHMLTKEAFNALLKTLEDPPKHVKFLFATTEPHKIPSTILSRCQRLNLSRISVDLLSSHLKKIADNLKIEVEPAGIKLIAELSEGSGRDALSLLDHVMAYQSSSAPITLAMIREVLGLPDKNIFFELDEAGSKKNYAKAFEISQYIFNSGKNISFFLEELIRHFRTLLLIKNNIKYDGEDEGSYKNSAKMYCMDQLLNILDMLVEGDQTIKQSLVEKTALEMLLFRIMRTHHTLSLDLLIDKLLLLENRLKSPQATVTAIPEKKTVSPPQEKSCCNTISIQEKSRSDTIMNFAAKELNGSLKRDKNG